LRGPTDDPGVIREAAARLIGGVDTTAGVRLLGVGVSGLTDFTQEDLFAQASVAAGQTEPEPATEEGAGAEPGSAHAAGTEPSERRWLPGQDVRHAEHGPGWVQGSGIGRVTVRFEEPGSAPGRVRTFSVDDPALEPVDPPPLKPAAEVFRPVQSR
jgi:DNA polymerase-4